MKRSPLKPGKPLERRSRLTGDKPLARLRALNPISAKRRKENAVRRAALTAAFGTHPRCTLCTPLQTAGIYTGCSGWADDGDEVKRRSAGGSITDVTNVRPVGRRCHEWITANPARAHDLGLTLKSWETK